MQQLAPTQGTATTGAAEATQAGLPPYARPTSGMNPMHAKTESTLAPTSEFTRLFLIIWIVRYIPRGLAKFLFDKETIDIVKNGVANPFLNKFATGPNARKILDTIEAFSKKPENAAFKRFLDNLPEWEQSHLHTNGAGKAASGLDFKVKLPGVGAKESITRGNAAKKAAHDSFLEFQDQNPQMYENLYTALRKKIYRPLRGNTSEEIQALMKGLRRHDGQVLLTNDYFNQLRDISRKNWDDMAYGLFLGLGSAALSVRYSMMVRNDIKSIFSEVVGYEKGVPPDQVNFSDISASENKIIKQTVHNYWAKLRERLTTDALFLAVTPFKSEGLIDAALGVKGLQIFGETWKRKTTLFEDITTFVNNKINPRNGLGQPVTVGEIFDLYQHYTEQFAKDRTFTNVVERGTGEGGIWANNQPIFQRIAELMNLTYAYKHPSLLDEHGNTVHQANFPLPKLIYLLGHDLIDTRNPETTLAYIEVANRHGMEAVKDMTAQLSQGIPLEKMLEKYPIPALNTKTAAAQPVIETPNSITKVNHADRALDIPSTQVNAITHENAETLAIPGQAVAIV